MPTDRLQIEAVTQDALRLCVEHVPAVGQPRGAVMIGHAMMANQRSVDRPRGKGLASTLASHGLHVYTYDCRGHGRSLERSPEGSNYRYDDIVRFDLAAVAGLLRTRHPRLPLGGVGHSLTGHAGLAWLGLPEVADPDRASPLDLYVTIGANIWVRTHEPSLLRWSAKRAMFGAMSGLTRIFGRLPAKRLGYGSDDVSQAFIHDTARFLRRGFFGERGTDYLAGTARIRVPVLGVAGQGDWLICDDPSWRRLHRRIPDHTLLRFGEAETGFDPGHMDIVTSQHARPVWETIARWIVQRFEEERSPGRVLHP